MAETRQFLSVFACVDATRVTCLLTNEVNVP
jgi:hypothetical protein